MDIDKTSPLYQDLRSLTSKYGAALMIELVNYIFVAALIFIAAGVFCGLTGIDMNSGSGAGYLVSMLVNDIASYAFPIAVFYAMFKKDIEAADLMLSLAGDEMKYRRFTGETILLLLAGLFMASTGSLATSIVSGFLNDLFSVPEPQTAFSDSMPPGVFEFVTFEIASVIVAPICEELIYRHLLLKPLRRYSDMTAAVVSAMIFGISHFNFDQFLYTFFFGFALAVITMRSGSIVPAVICHMANNLIAGMTVYMPETFGSDILDSLFGTLASLCSTLSVLMFWAGIPATVIVLVSKLARLKSASYVPVKTQFAVMFSQLFVILGLAASLVLTFLLLYR